jgi:hypothetical protein
MRNIFKFKAGTKTEKESEKAKLQGEKSKDKKVRVPGAKKDAQKSKSFYGNDDDLGYC